MEYSYKFRLYPNRKQETQMLRTFGCCRFVFNHYLADRIETYKETGKSPTRFEQDRNLTVLKKQEETSWLREVDATALQSSLRDLDDAYQNFFRRVKHGEKPGFPRFKSKHDHRQSYKSKCVGTNIKVLDKAIQLPKLGAVKCRISKEVKGRILSATVSRNPSGKYFVALCCTDAEVAALPMTGSCRTNQLLAGSGIQRVDPADYRVASAQAQGFAGELQRAFIAVWLQQQNTFAVQTRIA